MPAFLSACRAAVLFCRTAGVLKGETVGSSVSCRSRCSFPMTCPCIIGAGVYAFFFFSCIAGLVRDMVGQQLGAGVYALPTVWPDVSIMEASNLRRVVGYDFHHMRLLCVVWLVDWFSR